MPMDCSIAPENTASPTPPADCTIAPPPREPSAACAPPPWGPRFAAAAAGPKPARNGQKTARSGSSAAARGHENSGQKRSKPATLRGTPALTAALAAGACRPPRRGPNSPSPRASPWVSGQGSGPLPAQRANGSHGRTVGPLGRWANSMARSAPQGCALGWVNGRAFGPLRASAMPGTKPRPRRRRCFAQWPALLTARCGPSCGRQAAGSRAVRPGLPSSWKNGTICYWAARKRTSSESGGIGRCATLCPDLLVL